MCFMYFLSPTPSLNSYSATLPSQRGRAQNFFKFQSLYRGRENRNLLRSRASKEGGGSRNYFLHIIFSFFFHISSFFVIFLSQFPHISSYFFILFSSYFCIFPLYFFIFLELEKKKFRSFPLYISSRTWKNSKLFPLSNTACWRSTERSELAR